MWRKLKLKSGKCLCLLVFEIGRCELRVRLVPLAGASGSSS